MGEKRDRYAPDGGKELKSDDSVFDVTAWRESIETDIDAKTQTRNNQKHQRVYDPTSERLLLLILDELMKMNQHLEIITEEQDL